MPISLATHGYEIHQSILSEDMLNIYRAEADRVANEAKSTCVRNLRRKSTLFDKLALSETLKSFLPVGFSPVRSILFDKTQKENWAVTWHQDLTIAVANQSEVLGYNPWSIKDGYPHVQPPTELLNNMVTVRLHLDNTPSTNGALRVIPHSHQLGKLTSDQIAQHSQTYHTTCDCSAGDILLMKPLILHSSQRSELPERRRIIHLEYAHIMDLHPSLQWAE